MHSGLEFQNNSSEKHVANKYWSFPIFVVEIHF